MVGFMALLYLYRYNVGSKNAPKMKVLVFRLLSGLTPDKKDELLASLRQSGIYVLSKGAIENYYPAAGITGGDKPSKAQSYRNVVTTRDQVVANCPTIQINGAGVTKPELELICEAVFSKN
jgi:hypothetical protein